MTLKLWLTNALPVKREYVFTPWATAQTAPGFGATS